MAAHSVFYVLCFLCLYFFVRQSSSEFKVSYGFKAKHVLKKDTAVNNIPFSFIRQKFNEVQNNDNFLENEFRPWHTFFVTPNLATFLKNLIEAYKMSNKMKEKYNKNFTSTNAIEIEKLQKNVNVGVIDIQIYFDEENRKYTIVDDTCYYSDKGTFRLGAINPMHMMDLHVINHLSNVELDNKEKCLMDPPPGSCKKKITKEKKNHQKMTGK